ncbi:MAG TPA: hypothetical protein VML75_25585, partial [Kofleriaceae bacterium]|nr:hypothetical protein [Kofleriaceae bacterium]
MWRTIVSAVLVGVMTATAGACGCRGPKYPQPTPGATLEQVLTRLGAHNDEARSFRTKSTMD